MGVSFDGISFGCYSKYLQGFAVVGSAGDQKIEQTLELINLAKPEFVMAVSEPVIRQLNDRRALLPPETKLLFGEREIVDSAFDKVKTLLAARRLDISTPTCYSPEKILELGRLPEGVRFPLVLKPPVPYSQDPWCRHDFKYKYCLSLKEVSDTLEKFRGAPYLPLVQEYCPGRGVGIELCMHNGEAVAAFQHERLREIPPTGGVSVMRRSVPLHRSMFSDSVRLLKALNWQGVAMVEFRYDYESNKYWLMEINGRFWGSICLPVVCGINFPFILLETMGFGKRPSHILGSYPTDIYCRQLSADLRWLFTVLRMKREELPPELRIPKVRLIASFLRDFLRFPYYDVEWPEDPRPALQFWKERLTGILAS